MPPPRRVAELVLRMLSVIVAVPTPLLMPPPTLPVLPLRVLLVTVIVSKL